MPYPVNPRKGAMTVPIAMAKGTGLVDSGIEVLKRFALSAGNRVRCHLSHQAAARYIVKNVFPNAKAVRLRAGGTADQEAVASVRNGIAGKILVAVQIVNEASAKDLLSTAKKDSNLTCCQPRRLTAEGLRRNLPQLTQESYGIVGENVAKGVDFAVK